MPTWPIASLSGQMPADDALLARTRPRAANGREPRFALGQALAGVACAAIDISDGLLQDLGHILKASRVGARLYLDDLPVSAALAGLPADRVRHAAPGRRRRLRTLFYGARRPAPTPSALSARMPGLPSPASVPSKPEPA